MAETSWKASRSASSIIERSKWQFMNGSNIDERELDQSLRVQEHEAASDHVPAHAGDLPEPPPLRKRVLLLPLLAVAGLLGYGAFKHWETDQRAVETQNEAIDYTPEVTTIAAKTASGPHKLTLPGQTEPFYTATLYSRATGYVAERRVDIGSRVKKGDLLIRIAAPDLDAQLAQSRAQSEQAKEAEAEAHARQTQAQANLSLAQITSKRFEKLTREGYQTAQNNDNQSTEVQSQRANVATAKAGVKVATANTQGAGASVQRLEAQASFERVLAPFDGVITARGAEIGDLLNADNHTGAALFTVAFDNVLRVTVHVPQSEAFAIHEGLIGSAYLPEKPTRTFTGHVARSSIALLDSARTLATEIDIDNPDGALKPGVFVNVTIDIPRRRPRVIIPAETLIYDHNVLRVAVVEHGQVRLRKITVDRDSGRTLELRDGVNEGDQLIMNPPPDLTDGMTVKIKATTYEQ